MSGPTDAATVAASIDVSTVAGHNLRALLLRLADGDGSGLPGPQVGAAHRLRLVDVIEFGVLLTPLGREVAERLRPEPWRWDVDGGAWVLARFIDGEHSDGQVVRIEGDGHGVELEVDELDLVNMGLAQRIAALLTADDLRAAKAYRTEPTS